MAGRGVPATGLLLAAAVSVIGAADLYVSPAGNDAASGTMFAGFSYYV